MPKELNQIIYYTHSLFCKEQLIQVFDLFKNQAENSTLLIVDLYKKNVSYIKSGSEKISVVKQHENIYEVSSYPRFCIHRNNKCCMSVTRSTPQSRGERTL